jgi:AcrR family transcriptional regulator
MERSAMSPPKKRGKGDSKKKGAKVRTPRQERGIRTRDLILEAGERLFSDKGFHGTNSKEIAAIAGVSVGSFYSYFKDKKAVFFAVLERYNQRVLERVSTPPNGKGHKWKSARSLLDHLLKNALAAHDFSPQFHREATAMRYSDPEVESFFEKEDERLIQYMESLFSAFKEEIRVKDTRAAALVIHMAIEEVIHSIKIFGAKIDEKRLLKELGDMISRYLFVLK